MSVEENKAVVSHFSEQFWGQGNTAAADEVQPFHHVSLHG